MWPNLILREFAAIQTSQHERDRAVGGWTGHGNFKKEDYPFGATDQYEDHWKGIFNSILKEELSDSDSEAPNRGAMSRWGFVIEIKLL